MHFAHSASVMRIWRGFISSPDGLMGLRPWLRSLMGLGIRRLCRLGAGGNVASMRVAHGLGAGGERAWIGPAADALTVPIAAVSAATGDFKGVLRAITRRLFRLGRLLEPAAAAAGPERAVE